MGGTFDPIHIGHLVAAQQSFCQFNLDKVIFIPTGEPPHKEKPVASAKDRFRMTLVATAGNDNFEVSDIETKRKGFSYTVDTLKEIKKIYPQSDLFFITGADAVFDILDWKNPEEAVCLAHIIAANRPGHRLDKLKVFIDSIPFKVNISILEVPALAISSTDIRERLSEKKSIKYLLPESVCSYIYKCGLYRHNRDND